MIPIISLVISIISGLAALFAIMGYLSSRPTLIQFMDTNKDSYSCITEGQIYYEDDMGNIRYLPAGILVHYQFFNSSPRDIAYFHLGFEIDGKITEAFTELSVSPQAKKPTFRFFDLMKTYIISFPKEPQGIFKANSLTPIYGFLPIESFPPKEVTFFIRYAIRKFPYIGKRNYYTTFKHTVTPNDFVMITQANRKVIQQLKQKANNSKVKKHTSKNKKIKNNIFHVVLNFKNLSV
ncbi:hypothetical protein ACM665_05255 [Enterococcus faecalis]